MPVRSKDLWSLALAQPEIDPADLAAAIQRQAAEDRLDFRTRLLIRDSLDALTRHWGQPRLTTWLASCPARSTIETIWREDLGEPGFSLLGDCLVEKTEPKVIEDFLRELGGKVSRLVRLEIGGSVALILPGYIERRTQDIDVVNEVPPEIRSLHKDLNDLKQRYRLLLTHFQSHYLPDGWEKRVHSLGSFGRLQVFLVDACDVVLSKLFSRREKDLDDLRVVVPQLEKPALIRRLQDATAHLRGEEKLRQAAGHNWYILFGESLPS